MVLKTYGPARLRRRAIPRLGDAPIERSRYSRALQSEDFHLEADHPLSPAADLVALISETIPLLPDRGSFRGACPGHPDPTRGLYVSSSSAIFHCFSCGRGGGATEWIALRGRSVATRQID